MGSAGVEFDGLPPSLRLVELAAVYRAQSVRSTAPDPSQMLHYDLPRVPIALTQLLGHLVTDAAFCLLVKNVVSATAANIHVQTSFVFAGISSPELYSAYDMLKQT